MIIAIIDAGLSGPRSAELMMAPVAGEPFIWRVVERVRQARTLTKLVIATSRDKRDDALCGYLISRGQTVFRGDADDLVGGYAKCAETAGARYIACLKADTCLIDPGVIDEAVRYAQAARAPMVCNTQAATYPKGLEVEVLAGPALVAAAAEAKAAERACPTGFIRNRPDRFETAHFKARRDWSAFDWTAGSAAGFAFARSVFEALHCFDPAFGVEEALDYLDRRPDLVQTRSASAA